MIDILMVSETKLDDTFPTSQFLMQGYSTPFKKDVREDVSCKIIKTEIDAYYEGFSLKLT